MADPTELFTVILILLYIALLAVAFPALVVSAWSSQERRHFTRRFLERLESMNPPDRVLNLDRITTLALAMEPRRHGFTGSDERILENLLKKLYSQHADQRSGHDRPDVVDENLDLLAAELKRLSTETPFERLGAPEAQLLHLLRGGQYDGVARELAGLIVEKDTGLATARKRARWATPLAVLGLLVTAIFGVLEII